MNATKYEVKGTVTGRSVGNVSKGHEPMTLSIELKKAIKIISHLESVELELLRQHLCQKRTLPE